MPLISTDELTEPIVAMLRHRTKPEPVPASGRPPVPTARLWEALGGRRSVREYSDREPYAETLTAIMELAESTQARQWAGRTSATLFVVALGVAGLSRGLHDRNLRPVCGVEFVHELRVDYANAPAIILIGDSVGTTADYGDVLVRAGAIGYAIWLAARSYGLEACVYGATNLRASSVINKVAPGQRHLFTVALGYAMDG
ncbi:MULTISPECIES: nitroreductase family protein [unclassified Nonomuraea]|uniref:nitroreductase family protein n=1 Tax=unclassified Nonomuraea TaxID=2593643 RepID=UPI00137690F2|nr:MULTISPECIES: nitroreductase family protein [unclassified Nonomuraea]NBE92322.1 hypothetical protein [Nonomuraea sp. K271]